MLPVGFMLTIFEPFTRVPDLESTFVIFAKLSLTWYLRSTLLVVFNLIYSLSLVLLPIPSPKTVPPNRTDWSRYRLKFPFTP